MRAIQLRLAWQWTFVFVGELVTGAPLRWHHTEFGRRTDCGTFRVVHQGSGWQLLDAEWNPLGAASTIPAAQQLAERLQARTTAAARRTSVPIAASGGGR